MIWVAIIGLPFLWGLITLPKWWRQPRPVRGPLPGDRSWLVKVVFLATLELSGIVQVVSVELALPHAVKSSIVLVLLGIAGLCICLIVPVNYLSAFDFLVAPGLRKRGGVAPTDTPDRHVAESATARSDEPRCHGVRPVVQDAFIRVRRENAGWADRFRSYGIEIDGEVVGHLRRGDEIRIGVVPGPHVVCAVISWTGSLPMQVRVTAGRTINLRVESGMDSLLYGVRPDAYLRIVKE